MAPPKEEAVAAPSDALPSPSPATSSSPSPSESLRRSKRNKFHLDVSSMHLVYPERRRAVPLGRSSPATSISPAPHSSVPSPFITHSALSPQLELTKRAKTTAKCGLSSSSTADRHSLDTLACRDEATRTVAAPAESSSALPPPSILLSPLRQRPFPCKKCPSSFDTRTALMNHADKHGGPIRRLSCDKCDYSVESANAMKLHRQLHADYELQQQLGVAPPPLLASASPPSSAISATEELSIVVTTPAGSAAKGVSVQTSPMLPGDGSASLVPPVAPLTLIHPLSISVDDSNDGPPPLHPVEEEEMMDEAELAVEAGRERIEDAEVVVASAENRQMSPPPLLFEQEKAQTEEASSSAAMPPPTMPKLPRVPTTLVNGRLTYLSRYLCQICPFSSRDNERLEKHCQGHRRPYGFLCPLCSFKSESAGFLRRHVGIHGVAEYPWPPVYVGVSPRRTREANAAALKGITPTPLPDLAKEEATQPQAPLLPSQAPREGQAAQPKKSGSAGESLSSCPRKRRPPPLLSRFRALRVAGRLGCPLPRCSFSSSRLSAIISHRQNMHKNSLRLPKGRQHCNLCGRVLHRSIGALLSHKRREHGQRKKMRADLFGFFMAEACRIPWKRRLPHSSSDLKLESIDLKKEEVVEIPPAEEVKKEEGVEIPPAEEVKKEESLTMECEETTETIEEKHARIPSLPSSSSSSSLPAPSESTPPLLSPSTLKKPAGLFQCPDCPYSANIRSRVDRHRSKHVIKEDNQCSYCTFSCRDADMLSSHERLHRDDPPLLLPQMTPPTLLPPPALSTGIPEEEPAESAQPSSICREDQLGVSSSGEDGGPPLLTKEGDEGEDEEDSSSRGSTGVNIPSGDKPKLPRSKFKKIIIADGTLRIRCDECPYLTKHFCDLRAHKAMHIGSRQYKCNRCTYSTKRAVSLQVHIKSHEEEEEELEKKRGEAGELAARDGSSPAFPPDLERQEPKQEAMNGNAREYEVRVRGHGTVGVRRGNWKGRQYLCSQCPFVAPHIYALWRHARRHGTRRSEFSCSLCCFSTHFQGVLRDHQEMHSLFPVSVAKAADGSYRCSRCSFSSLSHASAVRHFHPRPLPKKSTTPIRCDLCTFVGASLSALAEHSCSAAAPSTSSRPSSSSTSSSPDAEGRVNLRSSKGGPAISFDLESSRRLMRPSADLAVLLRTSAHGPSSEHQCPECPFSDPDELIYNLHRIMHTGAKRAFECNVCSYSAFSADGLHRHISLHIPPMSPGALPVTRRPRIAARRRVSTEVIPAGVRAYECQQCPFRTADSSLFQQHRIEHAQHIQQRLVTQIKRAAAHSHDDFHLAKKVKKDKSTTIKNSKILACSSCSFHCDSAAALTRHRDLHGNVAPFKCRICDYASCTKQVTDYHEQTHHIEQPLMNLVKQATLQPEHSNLAVPSTLADRVCLAGQLFVCMECGLEFLDSSSLLSHWEGDHGRRGDDTACHLALGMLPASRILTKA